MSGTSPLARLLIASQFAFNVGFFAVLPYLAEHLSGALGLGGALVGLILGLRTFSQQGLFVIGGALTDRYGPRPVVLAGCGLRAAGFAWLGFAESTGTVIGSVVLVGFAAALFSPAVETELAREAVRIEEAGAAHGGKGEGPSRTRVLARFSAGGQAGTLIGPVVGALLLYATPGGNADGHFRAACLAGAAVFVAVLAGHWRLMPRTSPSATSAVPPERLTLRRVMRNRRFLGLAVAYSAYLLAYNQLYLAVPAELDRATGSQAALGWLFALSSAMVVAGQVPLDRWTSGRLSWPASIRAGLGLIAAAFAMTGILLPVGGPWPALAFVVLLTLGQMLVVPAARACVPELVDARRLGLFTGALSSIAGLTVLVGGAPVGALLELEGPGPWWALSVIPALGLLAVPRVGEELAPGTRSSPADGQGPTGACAPPTRAG
ncbi:MFS transporter [Streptomyces sp. H27-H1]|nr:MFS transporter [Streptomyces sp. H27-H1]MCY0925087.1 MFS transporter [Streptomyces sp. H27-H1]